MDVLELRDQGLYCPPGDFYIDPWKPVDTAVITHAHGDHAYSGHNLYIASPPTADLIIPRLGNVKALEAKAWGEVFQLGDCKVSLHPAGHILGSAQVRVEYKGEVWVMTGDFKRQSDPSCENFEVVPCDSFVMESTFAYPLYDFPPGSQIAQDIYDWWKADSKAPSLLFCYSLGKAQRLIAELRKLTDEPIFIHGAIANLNPVYEKHGIHLGELKTIGDDKEDYSGQLILAPPSAHRSQWMKRFKNPQTAFASGWMLIRGNRRRRGYERGFVVSDHADWKGLLETIKDCGAQKVFITHGSSDILARYLREEKGIEAQTLATRFQDEGED